VWEFAENLHRAELTVLERDSHIAKWIRLIDERQRRWWRAAISGFPAGLIGFIPHSGSSRAV